MAQVNHWTEQEKKTAQTLVENILQNERSHDPASKAKLVLGQLKHAYCYGPANADLDWDHALGKSNNSPLYKNVEISIKGVIQSAMTEKQSKAQTAERIVEVLIKNGIFPPN